MIVWKEGAPMPVNSFADYPMSWRPEIPAGAGHIVPYWVQTLGKDTLVAYQASRRGGTLYCTQAGDRIRMSGNAAVYSVADIRID